MKRVITLVVCLVSLSSCVPKTQYEDREEELQETKQALQKVEKQQQDCDPSVLIEMKEQAQSLDILTQELIDRNTQLSKEVARLRVFEAQAKGTELETDKQLIQQRQKYEMQLERTRKTYEDLVSDLRKRLQLKERELQELKSQPAPASKKSP